jgi:hypothetical protein
MSEEMDCELTSEGKAIIAAGAVVGLLLFIGIVIWMVKGCKCGSDSQRSFDIPSLEVRCTPLAGPTLNAGVGWPATGEGSLVLIPGSQEGYRDTSRDAIAA